MIKNKRINVNKVVPMLSSLLPYEDSWKRECIAAILLTWGMDKREKSGLRCGLCKCENGCR
jgi:hypothetical protein